MVDLVLGIAAAVGASTLYSLGIALQALDAREAPQGEHLRPALVLGLLRRSRWLRGTGLSILGFPLQVLALHFAPLVVVQPALASADHDDRRRAGLRLERDRDQARLRRPLQRARGPRGRLGAVDGGGVGGRGPERDQRPADATGDPGRAGRVRDADRRAGDR